MSSRGTFQVQKGFSQIEGDYDAFFFDQYGVLIDGTQSLGGEGVAELETQRV